MGSVGTAIAYACLIRGSASSLGLYDIFAKKVRAEVLDLNHGSQFVPHCPIEGGDDLAVTAGSQIVVVTAGAKQKPGQTRLDLAAANVAMAQELTPKLLALSPDAVIVFVTNPVDVITYAAVKSVDAPPGRIFGSGTVLDSSRFRYLIAERADLAVGNVHGYIVDQFTLDGKLIFDESTKAQISHDVVNAAYEIIEGKGATNLAIGLSTARIIEAIRGHQHRVLPVSTLQTGAYGINDVCLSLPTVVTADGAGRVLEIPTSESELAGLQASAQTLHDAWASVTAG